MKITPELLATLITISATLFGYFFHAYNSRKMHEREEIRKNNAPLYESIVHFFIKLIVQSKPNMKPVAEKEILKFFGEITPKLMVWGGNDVVKAFGKFRTYSIDHPDDPQGLLDCMHDLIMAIRKELGHKDENINEYLKKLYLND